MTHSLKDSDLGLSHFTVTIHCRFFFQVACASIGSKQFLIKVFFFETLMLFQGDIEHFVFDSDPEAAGYMCHPEKGVAPDCRYLAAIIEEPDSVEVKESYNFKT